jgi:peptidoglycan/LPS O-acetylase OafA/YrhL
VTVSSAGFRYRPEIDALRGVAVLAVLVFHLNPHWLAGGFVGVDIFFVISGYVVTGSLLNHAHEPLPRRLAGFYLRRVRRLLPNLFACIGVTALATALLVPPRETRGLFTTAVKSLFGWSNNHLVGASKDYFGLDAALNPFVHTWSLGVEEQFYLVFPLLLVLCGFGGRRTLPLLLAGIVLSLGLSLWWTVEAPISAFFLMPSRFWELASGAALLRAQRRRFAEGWPSGPRVQLLGGALLVVALLFTPERQAFPAPAALPAVLGTLLLLQFRPGPEGHFLPLRWLERPLVAGGDLPALDLRAGAPLAVSARHGALLRPGLARLPLDRAARAPPSPAAAAAVGAGGPGLCPHLARHRCPGPSPAGPLVPGQHGRSRSPPGGHR